MAVTLTSEITIGRKGKKYRISGVNNVKIRRSLNSWVETATLTIPSMCNVINTRGEILPDGKKEDYTNIPTSSKLKIGDSVEISLGYDGNNKKEFSGFITSVGTGRPCVIEMDGYSVYLKKPTISGYWPEISVEDLLKKVIENTPMTCKSLVDVKLKNVKAVNATGAQILSFIKRETGGAVNIRFVNHLQLVASLIYSDVATGKEIGATKIVKFRIGFNCPSESELKKINEIENPIVNIFMNKDASGVEYKEKSKALYKLTNEQKKILSHLAPAFLKQMAQEVQDQQNYIGYSGSFTAFIQPYCLPGDTVYLLDKINPEATGSYLCESIIVSYGVNGARREIELGPKIGWRADGLYKIKEPGN